MANARLTSLSAPAGGAAFGFEELYEREYPVQLRRAMVLAATPDAAADAVHEAFVEVFRRWDDLTSPAGYLSRAVVNRCRDTGRRAGSRQRLHRRVLAERRLPVEPVEYDDELWQALCALPFNQRAAIALRYYDGYSEAEIAGLLDCAQGSVGPWIRRGLDRLRRTLEP